MPRSHIWRLGPLWIKSSADVRFPNGRYWCIGWKWRGRGPWQVLVRWRRA